MYICWKWIVVNVTLEPLQLGSQHFIFILSSIVRLNFNKYNRLPNRFTTPQIRARQVLHSNNVAVSNKRDERGVLLCFYVFIITFLHNSTWIKVDNIYCILFQLKKIIRKNCIFQYQYQLEERYNMTRADTQGGMGAIVPPVRKQ